RAMILKVGSVSEQLAPAVPCVDDQALDDDNRRGGNKSDDGKNRSNCVRLLVFVVVAAEESRGLGQRGPRGTKRLGRRLQLHGGLGQRGRLTSERRCLQRDGRSTGRRGTGIEFDG